MPLYEYQCDACGHRFEVIQKFSDPLVEACPKCGSAVRKLMSSPAIQFKGSGFYITDYAKKDYTEATKADRDSKGTKESTDTKAAKETKDTKDGKDTKKESTSEKTAASPSTSDSTSKPASSSAPASAAKKDS
jgi:putative FmdB family regulatory protein